MKQLPHLCRISAAALLTTTFVSCAGIYDRAEIYSSQQTTAIGAATVGLEFVPSQSESSIAISAMVVAAAESRSRGPYRIAIYAVGERGKNTHLTVTSLRMKTPNGRSWDVPAEYLLREEYFMSCRDRKLSQAVFLLAPLLDLNFKNYGEITVTAEVSIQAADGRAHKGSATFVCARQRRKSVQSYFIPTEIVHSIRLNDVPEEHLEIGANRRSWQLGR